MDFKLTKGQGLKNNDSENTENKVLVLNTKYTRRVQMRHEIHHKKGAVIASVLSLVAIVTLLNQNLISKNISSQSSRQIASAETELKLKAWKSDLLNELKEKTNRNIASYGEAPTPIEELRMGALEGKYAISIKENIISSIEFIETPDGDRPKSIKNFSDFIGQHLKAFNQQAVSIVEVGSQIHEDKKIYIFDVLNQNQDSEGKIQVTADTSNRLLSVKYTANEIENSDLKTK